MKLKIKQLILPALIVLGLVGALTPVTPAAAINVYQPCKNSSLTTNAICAGTNDSTNNILKTVVDTLLFVIGALAIIMIIVGGLRYVLSAGNAQAAASAKNTILYAVIGLVIAFLAYAIIHWVMGALQGHAKTS